MEINNRSHANHDAYLQKQQANDAGQNNVAPSEHIKEEQEDKQKSSKAAALSTTENSKDAASKTEQSQQPQSLELFEPINLTRARNNSGSQNNRMEYKVSAHEEKIAHNAEKAINSYHAVENSQYEQELVNRIEIMV